MLTSPLPIVGVENSILDGAKNLILVNLTFCFQASDVCTLNRCTPDMVLNKVE